MSEEVINSRQEKQSYICQNVDPNLYQDFHDFCTSYAGQIDIDKWSISYVYELVAKFKEFLIQKNQQQDKHEKSFAIYQTTSGNNQISGTTSQLQIDSVLETINQSTAKQEVSPNFTKKNLNVQNASGKKSIQKSPQNIQKSRQKAKPVVKNQPARQQKNSSFFDSVNFWEIPKTDQEKQKNLKNYQTPTFPNSPKTTIKLNINPSQFNTNNQKNINTNANTNVKKVQQPVNIKITQPKQDNKKSQSQDFNNFFTMTSNISNPNKNVSSPNVNKNTNVNTNKPSNSPSNTQSNLQSQFDTFSIIADQELKKKRTNTLSSDIMGFDSEEIRKKSNTGSIVLKQVKELKSNSSKLSKQIYKGPKIFVNQFNDQVACVKTANRPFLNQQNLRIQLKSHEIIQRSILSSNYIMYNMVVLPSGTVCKRNYEDFAKLKLTLEKFYPGIQMPYLQKQGWRSDTTEQYAKKQGQMLQFFMYDLLKNPEIRNSRVIEQFLTLQDHKKIKRKFEQYAKMGKIKSIQELCLLQGKVEVALTQKQRIYNQNMGKLQTKLEANVQKYKKHCENLSQYYSQTMSLMLGIDDILKQMQKDIEDFNRSVMIKEIQNLDLSLKKIRDNYKEKYFRTKFEKNIIDDSILPFLRYEKQNIHVSKQIIEQSNNLTSRYLKRLQSQKMQTSDSSYLSSAFNQHKQGILQESKSMVVLKYQVGFIQAQASSQLQRIMKDLGLKIDILWKQIGNKYLDQFARSINVYSSIV